MKLLVHRIHLDWLPEKELKWIYVIIVLKDFWLPDKTLNCINVFTIHCDASGDQTREYIPASRYTYMPKAVFESTTDEHVSPKC